MSDRKDFPLTPVDRGDVPFPSFSVLSTIVLQFTFMLSVFYVNQNKSFHVKFLFLKWKPTTLHCNTVYYIQCLKLLTI